VNLFDIMASGNRILKEEHISSVLAWILDPNHDHGLGYEPLKCLVAATFPGTPLAKSLEASSYTGLSIRERKRLSVSVELEKGVLYEGRSRSIDIVLSVDDKYVIAIENKISAAATQQRQVLEEAVGLSQDEAAATGKELYFIYLVPQKSMDHAKIECGLIPAEVYNAPLAWTGPGSLIEGMRELLVREGNGSTNPIPTESAFILKSFIRFANNGFSCSIAEPAENGTGSDYDTLVRGYLQLVSTVRDGYVGYQGGEKVLRNDLAEAAKDTAKKQWLLSDRPYKWSQSRRVNHKEGNWIALPELIKLFELIE